MLKVAFTNKMKRDIRRMQKRGKNMSKLRDVLLQLANSGTLPPRNKDHQLVGENADFRECHIEPDWLLIYKIIDNELILSAIETGTHSDLFG